MTDSERVPTRAFTSPSGRRWTASLAAAPVSSGTSVVLRFTSDDLVLDLEQFPADWERLPDEALVALVRRANPPQLGLPPDRATTRGVAAPGMSPHEQQARLQTLAADIAARLRGVCSHLPPADFDRLVMDIARMKASFEVLEDLPGGLRPVRGPTDSIGQT